MARAVTWARRPRPQSAAVDNMRSRPLIKALERYAKAREKRGELFGMVMMASNADNLDLQKRLLRQEKRIDQALEGILKAIEGMQPAPVTSCAP